jgi:pimeloyl-ACP methyl ester carboxylesterase
LNTGRDPASLRLTARMLLQLDPFAIDPLLAGRWLDGIDFHAVLRKVRCPVLLLQADKVAGGMLSDPEFAKMTGCLADVTPARFPGVGHLIHWLSPEALLRHVLAFLESLT